MKETKPDNSIRLKLTNRCQFSCSFCHNEGTELPVNSQNRTSFCTDPSPELEPIKDIPFEEKVLNEICELKRYGIDEIHLTGGEPTLNQNISDIVGFFKKNDFTVKMTSNGQFDGNLMRDIRKEGLNSINFSILSLNPDQFLETQIYKSQEWAKKSVGKLCSSIITAKELDMPVKVNTVINSKLDYGRVDQILKFCDELDMTLVLLNNVSLGKESEDAVFDYVREKDGVLVSIKEPSSNSRGKKTYLLPSGKKIEAKYFRNYYPDIVCRNCKNKETEACLEKYYGVRVELRDEFYARLCIQESNKQTLMPLNDFFDRNIYKSLN